MIAITRKRIALLVGLLGISGIVAGGLYFWSRPYHIVNYYPEHDREAILSLFKKDWYWLVPDELPDYKPEYYIDNQASSERPQDKGNMTIKVLYDKKEFCGFISYFKKTSYKGIIRFLAISSACRGKGYGQKLLEYAIRDLVKHGCTRIDIFTRINNERALALYHKLGFKEFSPDAKYTWLSKNFV